MAARRDNPTGTEHMDEEYMCWPSELTMTCKKQQPVMVLYMLKWGQQLTFLTHTQSKYAAKHCQSDIALNKACWQPTYGLVLKPDLWMHADADCCLLWLSSQEKTTAFVICSNGRMSSDYSDLTRTSVCLMNCNSCAAEVELSQYSRQSDFVGFWHQRPLITSCFPQAVNSVLFFKPRPQSA